MSAQPIQNLDSIDILGARREGGVDAVIVVSAYLDDTEESVVLLKTKMQNYVNFYYSDDFANEFGSPESTPYTIVVRFSEDPHKGILEWMAAFEKYLSEYGISVRADLQPPNGNPQ